MGQTEQVISIDRTSGTAASRRIGTTPLADDVELDATEGGLAPPTPPKPPAPPDYDDGIRWPDDVPNDEPPELVMTPTAREAINQILDAHKQGGFAVVSGLAGLGKTSMAMLLEQRLEQRYDPSKKQTFLARYFEVGTSSGGDKATMKRMCLSVYAAIAEPMPRGVANQLDARGVAKEVVNELALNRVRMLLIDEAGGLSVRDVRALMLIGNVAARMGHRIQIVLIGMDDLPRKVKKLPQIDRRVHAWVPFRAYSVEDTYDLLARLYPHFRALDPDDRAQWRQVTYVHKVCGGRPGLVVPFISLVERARTKLNWGRIDLELLESVHALRNEYELELLRQSGFGAQRERKTRRDGRGETQDGGAE